MTISDYATGLQHIGIPVENMLESMLFYSELGFEVIYCGKIDETHAANFLKLGDLVLELYENDDPKMKTGSIDHISINVKDVEAVYKIVTDHGLNNTEDEIHFLPFFENGVKYFIIEGPNKERVEFNQYL